MTRYLAILSFAFLVACGGKAKDNTGNTGNPCGDNPCGDNPCGDNPCGDNPCANPCGGGAGGAPEVDVTGWDGWTKVNEARFFSKGHGKSHVDTWTSDAAAVKAKTGPYAEGTKIVKAQYKTADATDVLRITVMVKMAKGYDPEHGDWYWAVMDAAGSKAMMQGKGLEACVGCHTQAQDRDWVIGAP